MRDLFLAKGGVLSVLDLRRKSFRPLPKIEQKAEPLVKDIPTQKTKIEDKDIDVISVDVVEIEEKEIAKVLEDVLADEATKPEEKVVHVKKEKRGRKPRKSKDK